MRCQAGDESAFLKLYNNYSEMSLRYLQNLLSNQKASDAHQEVWISVYENIKTLSSPGAFRTWMFQIARFEAIDILRKENREQKLLYNYKEEHPSSFIPEEEADIDVDNSHVLQAIDELPTKHREVIALFYWERMSYEEISLITGCPIGTVRSRISTAKNKLNLILKNHEKST